MISDRMIDQAFSDLKDTCGGVRDDYFGLLYLEREHKIPRDASVNQVAFGGNDYGLDGFHFDEQRRNLYLYQFKNSPSHQQFKDSLHRLIDAGIDRIFVTAHHDDTKNQILLQLQSCMIDNRMLIEQVCFRFVFTGDAEEAGRSQVLDKLREDLENKKYLVDRFFNQRNVGFVVEFRSATGRVGDTSDHRETHCFDLAAAGLMSREGPQGQLMHIGFIKLADLHRMHLKMGPRFFERNIRYGLGDTEAVNRAISRALKAIVIDFSENPGLFAFNHNGIALFAEGIEELNGCIRLISPRLLNGAQTVTTTTQFFEKFRDHPKLQEGLQAFESIQVLCKIITEANQGFVTSVTINNNRQNPVEPWNLHANDLIQLELQDKFREELKIFYERQERSFEHLSLEDLEEQGITEARAIQMVKLAQTFLMTDGTLDRVNRMRQVFEDERLYGQVFSGNRLRVDARHIVLCYKVQFRLRKLTQVIEDRGAKKYAFVGRARYLLWALLCQGLLNDPNLEELAEQYGTSMSLPANLTAHLTWLSTARVRLLLSDLISDPEYVDRAREQNLGFLRTNRAFDKCMELGHRKWRWVHKKLK